MPAFSLLVAPHVVARRASLLPGRSPTMIFTIPSFGNRLSPVTLSAQARLTSELLRTL